MSCSCFGGKSFVRRRDPALSLPDGIEGDLLRETNHFSYNELRSATNDFHLSNRIGRGGFGTVYKGTLRDGVQIAVKMLSAQSKQGVREFLNEIKTISKVKHCNLVELIGCCVQGANRILVYEYVENNSLDRALLDPKNSTLKLDWSKRSAICLGIARGLVFLHEELVPHIVHRDIKSSNILLDTEFNPKIGDFGLAKLFPDDITHISTRIAGTTGYLAPEYALGGQLTLKADVYSFGVLILEIISGRSSAKPKWGETEKLLLEWIHYNLLSVVLTGNHSNVEYVTDDSDELQAWELYEEGRILELVDPEMGNFTEEEVIRHIKVAFFCTQAVANRRPLMSQVVDMISKNIRLNEKLLSAPGFFETSSSKTLSSGSTSYQTTSVAASITEVTPR